MPHERVCHDPTKDPAGWVLAHDRQHRGHLRRRPRPDGESLRAEAALHVAREVRTIHLDDPGTGTEGMKPSGGLRHLEWADGIAFGTPAGGGRPDGVLVNFIESSEPLWESGRLYDKAVTVFTDEPERVAPDSILHPLYDSLYRWGAVIVGPRDVDLGWEAAPGHRPLEVASLLPAPRMKAAQYRAHRLTRIASVLAEDRARRQRLQL